MLLAAARYLVGAEPAANRHVQPVGSRLHGQRVPGGSRPG